jgi:hypothetical protein
MSRFLSNAKRSLDSLRNLITDLAGDGLLFFRLLFRSRTALSAEVLFLRKQLTFYEERQVQTRRMNDGLCLAKILSGANAFEISDIQEVETEGALPSRPACNNVALPPRRKNQKILRKV